MKRFIYSAAVLSSLLASPGAFAKISPLAFKGITKNFKKGKEYFSPTLGEGGLETGFIEGLRLNGNFTPTYTKEQKRDYINDKANDSVSELLKILFPSSGGNLSDQSTAKFNFGKNVRDPKTISILLNYANAIREGSKPEGEKIVEDLFSTFKLEFKNTEEELKKKGAFSKKLDNVDTKDILSKNNLKRFKENLLEIFGNENKDKNIKNLIKNSLNDKEFNNKIKDKSIQEQSVAIKEKAMETLNNYFEKQVIEREKSFKEGLKKETISPLLASIKTSIEEEEEKNAPYAKYTTEQVISAFFCFKFNTQKDIWDLLNNLDDSIVNKKNIPNEEDYLTEKDLKNLGKKKEAYDLDDVFDLAISDMFSNITPYREGSTLLSNGNTYEYDRGKGEILEKSKTFADCFEMAIRHMVNIITFNPLEREFDFSHIKEHMTGKNQSYFKNFEEFYKKQRPSFSNSGSIDMRSLWNTVVGDLNQEESNDIRYLRIKNELDPGFINLVNVFQKIFQIPLEPFPKETLKKKQWVEESLQSIFTALNPNNLYTLEGIDKLAETKNDFSGKIIIKVKDKKSNENLYSFQFYADPGIHATTSQLKILKKAPEGDYTSLLKEHQIEMEEGTAEDILWLLPSQETGFKKEKIKNPFYLLFSKPLEDNDSKINLLKEISENHEFFSKVFLEKSQILRRILNNILETISWDDPHVQEKILPFLRNLYDKEFISKEDLPEIKNFISPPTLSQNDMNFVGENIKTLESLKIKTMLEEIDLESFKDIKKLMIEGYSDQNDHRYYIKKINGLGKIHSLEELSIKGQSLIKELPLKILAKLKKLSLEQITISYTDDLKFLESLENLSLSHVWGTQRFPFEELKNLKKLTITPSKNAQLYGIDKISQLEELNIYEINGDEEEKEYMLQGLKFLRDLNLSYSEIEKISLQDFPSLEKIKYSGCKIDNLYLKNLDNLKEMLFDSFYLKTEIKNFNFETLLSLESLDLQKVYDLKTLSFRNLPKLKELFFGKELISSIKGFETLSQLQTLSFHKIDQEDMKKISAKNFKNLTHLTVYGQDISQIEDLNYFSSLENINLEDNKETSNVYLNGLENLKGINLTSSSVKKISLKSLPKLESIHFRNNESLNEVYLSQSGVKELHMEKISHLKKIDLKDMNHLESIFLKNISIESTSKWIFNNPTKKYHEFENFLCVPQHSKEDRKRIPLSFFENSNLRVVKLEEISNLGTLEFNHLHSLEEVSLKSIKNLKNVSFKYTDIKKDYGEVEHSGSLKKLTLESMDELENLDLRSLEKLESIEFRGSFANLKEIYLNDAISLKSIDGLDNLRSLKRLNLNGTSGLQTLTFTQDNKDLQIEAKSSGLKRAAIKGLEHLTDGNLSMN